MRFPPSHGEVIPFPFPLATEAGAPAPGRGCRSSALYFSSALLPGKINMVYVIPTTATPSSSCRFASSRRRRRRRNRVWLCLWKWVWGVLAEGHCIRPRWLRVQQAAEPGALTLPLLWATIGLARGRCAFSICSKSLETLLPFLIFWF